MNTTIKETFTLPSKGMIYDTKFDPNITLRSMTTMEEMKRLSYSDSEYKLMCEIIEDCLQEKLPISVYDMCLGDYQFLLHKLRVVTYGPEYNMTIQCPNCGNVVQSSVNLDEIEVFEYDDSINELKEITLPMSKKKITLKFQTPRTLDMIKDKAKELKRKTKEDGVNYEILYTIMSFIDKVDGINVNEAKLEMFVRNLPMKDVNYIIQKGDRLNRKVGLDTSVIAKCKECKYEVVTTFRFQPEFFGPQID